MQVLISEGQKDKVIRSYTEGDRILHQLLEGNGAWQWGVGADAVLVKSVDEVKSLMPDIPPSLLAEIEAWLNTGGPNAAVKDKRMRVMEQMAQKQPGTIDAMLAELGDAEVTATIHETLKALLQKNGSMPDGQPATVQKLEHGALVQREDGTREFVPTDDLDANSILEREQALDAAEDEDSMAAAIAGSVQASTEQAVQQVKKKRR